MGHGTSLQWALIVIFIAWNAGTRQRSEARRLLEEFARRGGLDVFDVCCQTARTPLHDARHTRLHPRAGQGRAAPARPGHDLLAPALEAAALQTSSRGTTEIRRRQRGYHRLVGIELVGFGARALLHRVQCHGASGAPRHVIGIA